MIANEATEASRDLEIRIHFCRAGGMMSKEQESSDAHLAAPEGSRRQDLWDGGAAGTTLKLRMTRFTADTGDQGLRLSVRNATRLPEFHWTEAQLI